MRKIYGFVYLVRNRVSGKVYVGQTKMGIERRWITHKSDAKLRPKSIFHKALKKYGPENFDVVELGRAFSPEELNAMEVRAVWTHSSDDREFGYNLMSGGNQSAHSEESRKKMSEMRIGIKFSPEHCANISAGKRGLKWSAKKRANFKGWKLSPEILARRANAGRKISDKGRANMRAAKLNQSPETRAKISASNLGRVVSEETRKKIATTLSGRTLTEEHCKKVSNGIRSSEAFAQAMEATRGRVLSEEHRAKLRAARAGLKQSSETIAKRVAGTLATKRANREARATEALA